MIQQGDKYLIPITIKSQGVDITPSDIDGLKIQIGRYLKRYPNGELTYQNDKWYFPLTQKESLDFNHSTKVQVQVLIGDQIVGSHVETIDIGSSIIKGEWNEDS